jgi:hypothetical protein
MKQAYQPEDKLRQFVFLFPPVSQPSRFGQVVICIEYFVSEYVSVRLDTLFWAFSEYRLKNGFE